MPFFRFRGLLLAFVVLVFGVHAASAQQSWIEVQSPHFRVLTNGSERDGRNIANEFEQIRHVFALLFKTEDIGGSAPLTIVATRDAETFSALEPRLSKAAIAATAGTYIGRWEDQYAIVRLDVQGDQRKYVVYHDYTASVVHAREHYVPRWLDVGLANFYEATQIDGDRIVMGAPSRWLPALSTVSLIPVSDLLNPTSASAIYRDNAKVPILNAESWAIVHYMTFGKGMENGAKLDAYLTKLQDGTPQAQAFAQFFGDPHIFDRNLLQYIRGTDLRAGVYPADRSLNAGKFQAQEISPAEVSYLLGCVQARTGMRATARKSFETALKLDPKLGKVHEELGYLDFDAGKDEDASKEWKQALELDPTLARALFASTMMGKPFETQSHEELYNTQLALQQVTRLSARFAPAYAELALLEWRLGMMQLAFKDAHEAEVLQPQRAGYHILAGYILLRGKQPALAADYARFVAEHSSGPDHNEAVDLFQAIPADQRGQGEVPVLEVPEGSEIVRGVLLNVSCTAGPAPGSTAIILRIKPDGPADAEPLTFESDDGRYGGGYSDTLWWGSDHYSVCHHLGGHPALVAHKGGELFNIEVRDALPDAPPVKANTVAADAAKPQSASRNF
jgi:hypothetical protein